MMRHSQKVSGYGLGRTALWLIMVPGLVTLAGCGSSGGGYYSTGYPYNDFYYDRWRWGSCCYSPGYPVGPPERPPAKPEHPIERPPVVRPPVARPPVARPPARPMPRPTPRPARMR
jgi:hypothetical protein